MSRVIFALVATLVLAVGFLAVSSTSAEDQATLNVTVFYHYPVAETGMGSIEVIQTSDAMPDTEIELCVQLEQSTGHVIPVQDRSFNHHRWYEFQFDQNQTFNFVLSAECPEFDDFQISYAGGFEYSSWSVDTTTKMLIRRPDEMFVVLTGERQTITLSMYPAVQGLNWNPQGGAFVSIAAGLEHVTLNANRQRLIVPALATLENMGVTFIYEPDSDWIYAGDGLLTYNNN